MSIVKFTSCAVNVFSMNNMNYFKKVILKTAFSFLVSKGLLLLLHSFPRAPKPQRNYQYVPKPASSPSNKEFDPTQSAAYKMIHGITDEKKTFRQRPKPEELEPEFKPLNPEDDLGYEEETFKKFLPSDPSKQSRSFKLLQRYTKDEEEGMTHSINSS